ncbi:hypothetical protein ACVIU4_007487 [Bradyrhizobium barranii subsp. barranii]|nr:hypothetical protein [Bradyrhizobium japonicum]MCP1959676.1 hypothetical protein [Bradyrhizobium japonicum]
MWPAKDSGRDFAVGAHNLAGAFLNGGWQPVGFVLFAIGDNFSEFFCRRS